MFNTIKIILRQFYITAPISIISICLLLYSCQSQKTLNQDAFFENVQIHKHPNNVLKYTVNTTTKKPAKCFIKYYYTAPNKKTITLYTDTTATNTQHNITLIALAPNSAYKAQVIALTENATTHKVYEFELNTPELPPNIPTYTLLRADTSQQHNGFIFTNKRGAANNLKKDQNILIALNNLAQVVWYQEFEHPIAAYQLTPQNTIVVALAVVLNDEFSHTLIQELDFKGNILKNDSIPYFIHHSIKKDKDGNYVFISYEKFETPYQNETAKLGLDKIVRLNPQLQKTFEWKCNQFFNYSQFPTTCAAPYTKVLYGNDYNDWIHTNNLEIDAENNYVLSFRRLDLIGKINQQTQKLQWLLGKSDSFNYKGNFDMDSTAYFLQQHYPTLTSNNSLLLFDNGDHHRPVSRVLEMQYDEKNKKAKLLWEYKLPTVLYCHHLGSATLMPNNDVLINAGLEKNILQVNRNKQIVWQIKGSDCQYSVHYIKNLYATKTP